MRRALIVLMLLGQSASAKPTLEGVYTVRDHDGYGAWTMPRCAAATTALVDAWRGPLVAKYRGKHVTMREETWPVRFVNATTVVAVRPAAKDADHQLEVMLELRKGRRVAGMLTIWGLDKDGKRSCITTVTISGDYAP